MLDKVDFNLNIKNNHGFAALHYACEFGHYDVVKLLIDKGADVNLPGRKRKYGIMFAAENDYYNIVKLLIESGASNVRSDAFRRSPLIFAVMNGNVEIASYLLSKGAQYDKGDSSENSPLHYACAYGYYEMIDLLLEAGADLNQKNSWNLTPLLVALHKNHYRCIDIMIQPITIDVNCRDGNGRVFLVSTIEKFEKKSFELSEFLIKERGADVNIRDYEGNTCLHALAKINLEVSVHNENLTQFKKLKKERRNLFKKFFKLLISHKADLNVKNTNKENPISIAIENRNWFFVELCLEEKSLILNDIDIDDKTIIHYCKNLLSYKNGNEILTRIFNLIPNLKDFENVFDNKFGYNFLHYLINCYVSLYKNNWTNVGDHFNKKQQNLNKVLKNIDRKKTVNCKMRDQVAKELNRLEDRELKYKDILL